MESLLSIAITSFMIILMRVTMNEARRDVTCFENFPTSAVYCPTEEYSECAVNQFGAPAGCAKPSECGAAHGMEKLTCDKESNLCCCKARRLPCNKYQDENFEQEQLCPTFPNATACLMDDPNVEKVVKCRRSDDSVVVCADQENSLCAFDGDGRPRGCVPKEDCPGHDEIFYFDPKCNEQFTKCCCVPLVEVLCNDWTESPELKAFLAEEVDVKQRDYERAKQLENSANMYRTASKEIVGIYLIYLINKFAD